MKYQTHHLEVEVQKVESTNPDCPFMVCTMPSGHKFTLDLDTFTWIFKPSSEKPKLKLKDIRTCTRCTAIFSCNVHYQNYLCWACVGRR